MTDYEVTYRVIEWTQGHLLITGTQTHPDKVEILKAKNDKSAKRLATAWGGVSEFRNCRWVEKFGRWFKTVSEGNLEIKLLLRRVN